MAFASIIPPRPKQPKKSILESAAEVIGIANSLAGAGANIFEINKLLIAPKPAAASLKTQEFIASDLDPSKFRLRR